MGVFSSADWTTSDGLPALFVALDGTPFTAAFGASGEHAGAIALTHSGTIITTGQDTAGIFLLSKGGDGNAAEEEVFRSHGGSGGDGGAVTADIGGSISTSGDNATAFSAISQGGNGKKGGDAFSPLSHGFSGDGGTGGTADVVDVESSADITTSGAGSHGIVAQSLGGDGANAGGAGAIQGNHGFAGSGSAVSVKSSGNISATGSGSIGILAESRGGNHPSGPAGTSSTVQVNNSGSISATGLGSYGIEAISADGDVIVDLKPGSTVVGGDRSGAGVRIETNEEATIYNYGSLSALSDEAISISAGSTA